MPSPKNSLDLESWGHFLSQERSNDYEYNLLLLKFRSFYNEVRDYQRLHDDCSVTRTANGSATSTSNEFSPPRFKFVSPFVKSTGLISIPSEKDAGDPLAGLSNSNGLHVSNMKKKFFQNQDSGLPEFKEHSFRQNNTLQQFQNQRQDSSYCQQDTVNTNQHYNSSHNLSSLAANIQVPPKVTRPDIKQRDQFAANSRFPLSKSSERLDNINNNHLPVPSSLGERSIDTTVNANPISDTVSHQSDDNIYDAVSPDDVRDVQTAEPSSIFNMDSSKSSLALASTKPVNYNAAIDKMTPPNNANKTKTTSSNKSTPNDTTEQERSNNSFSSSIMLDTSNNTSSSLSLLPDCNNEEYGNYVNIDFFLKRSQTPSFDGLDDDSSESVTSDDQSCDDALKNLSSGGLATSSSSITPASSGDFLDDIRSPITNHSSTSSAHHFSTSPRDSNGSKITPPFQKSLSMIREHQTIPPRQALSRESSHQGSDGSALVEAQSTMRSFLSDLNLSPVDDVFEDKAQRRIVKESFAVGFQGRRKLRHLFLFNDVIVCAKYQASSKQKFTFDVKWCLNLNGVSVSDIDDTTNQAKFDREAIENQILAIRTNLMLLRGKMQQIKRSKDRNPSKLIKKLKKKRTELEAELVLLLPHLPLIIRHISGKKYTFFLSSNFDRNQWIESMKFLQSQLPQTKSSSSSPSSGELQAWIQTCMKNLNPSLGTFLLRSNCDDDLLYGDLYINLSFIRGISKAGRYKFCFEVDSYGHFSQKASSVVLDIDQSDQELKEEYVLPLDGAHTLRILLYEDIGTAKPSVVGKAHLELSRSWLLDRPVEKLIEFNSSCSLNTQLSYSNSELLSVRMSHMKLCSTFGLDITQVCKKEKTNVPLLIQLCVNEVERRGMREVGIYRMSGTSTDIQRLRKAFETNPYVAELLMRDIDINSVTGFLKLYLREMPEGLFINKLHHKFVAAFNMPQTNSLDRTRKLLELFHKIPLANQHTIIYLVEHLVKVHKFQEYNKMTLSNLATVIGPNILRPPSNDSSSSNNSDPFTAVVIISMAQAGILYFFLNRKVSNLPLTELDSSEIAKVTTS